MTPDIVYSLIRGALKKEEGKYILPTSGDEVIIKQENNKYILEFQTRLLIETIEFIK